MVEHDNRNPEPGEIAVLIFVIIFTSIAAGWKPALRLAAGCQPAYCKGGAYAILPIARANEDLYYILKEDFTTRTQNHEV